MTIWKACEDPPGWSIFPSDDSTQIIATGLSEQDAIQATRAVNSYDAMLAALKDALTYLGTDQTDDSVEAKATRATVTAAIKLAEGPRS